MKKFKIGVIGLGFVGASLAVVNANRGFDTIAIDVNSEKIQSFRKGNPDFYEPSLKRYLKNSIKKNKICFSENIKDIRNYDIIFITVGTPSERNGKINLQFLKTAVHSLTKVLKGKKTKNLLVVKSTVVPGTTESITKILNKSKNIDVVVNPEFLREGTAINDLLNPHLIVIGANKKQNAEKLEKYYEIFYKKKYDVLKTNFATAEFIKYANNAFLATKLSFINSIANICQNFKNVDVETVSKAIGKDERIGPLFLKAGPGFGGSCLPKDLNALINFSSKFPNVNSLFKAVKGVNEEQPVKIMSLLKDMKISSKNKVISILGLAFKKNTDDIREAISVKLVEKLLKNGFTVKVHDPMAINNFRKTFGRKISYFEDIKECLKDSQCCIILTDWNDYKQLLPIDFTKMKKKNIIDARRVLNPEQFSKFNFKAIGLGS